MAKKKDQYRNTVKYLIEHGFINMYREIFDHISISSLTLEMHITHRRLKDLKENPSGLKFGEVVKLADLLKTEPMKLFGIIDNQLKKEGVIC